MNIFARFLAVSMLLGLSVPAMAAERAIIVLDGSGSMWGQIEGVPKLEIARSALRDVLASAPAGLELGLMAYGHREKGNCADIELLVPPRANSGPAIIAAADNMKFLGKTPISAAVRQAADALRFTEDKATVILITDGIETCEADPCAIAAELEERGMDFTTHVVGFGLSEDEGRQVSCLAETTGGRYFPAGNAAELTTELTRAMSEAVTVAQAEPKPEPVAEAMPDASVEAPAEIPAGSTIEITWTGPDSPDDYITIVEKGAPEDKYNDYARTNRGSPAKITVPDAVGAYEIRYVMQRSKRVLASQDVTLTPVSAAVEAPAEIPAGSDFEVAWTGPDNLDDYITIVEKGAPEDKYNSYARTNRGSPAKIRAPDAVGAYEIRYVVQRSKRVLASQPVTLTLVSATLEILNTPVPGGVVEIAWTGPDNHDDYITVVEKGAPEDKYTDYARTNRGSPAKITMPKAVGAYEIRYVVQQSKRVLASAPVTLAEVTASLSAPGSAATGATLKVEWTGPANWEDFIEIVPANAPADTKPLRETRTSQGSPLSIFVPSSPGDYLIRYKMRDTGEVAAQIPLIVE